MELKGTIVTYSGFTPSNKNHVTIEVLGMENYFGNAIKSGDEVIIKINGEDKKAPVDETAENILKTAIGETRYNLSGSITNGQILWAMQEYASQERNRAISECIDIVKKEQLDTDDHYGYVACANILEKLKK